MTNLAILRAKFTRMVPLITIHLIKTLLFFIKHLFHVVYRGKNSGGLYAHRLSSDLKNNRNIVSWLLYKILTINKKWNLPSFIKL